jgi:hypothetical protein
MIAHLSQSRPKSEWAVRASAAPEIMQTLQDELPVRLIATPRADFRKCGTDELITDVVAGNREGFDFLPVVEGPSEIPDRVVGLIEVAHVRRDVSSSMRVRERMKPLSEDNLIGADASILSFIKGADGRPCRLVISGERITGLVTLSDLQKLPVRTVLFAFITHLEMVMAEAIRRDCRTPDEWKSRLGQRLSKLEDKVDQARKDDGWIDDLLFTEFADKKKIIKNSPAFQASKTRFEQNMRDVEELRNRLAHANDYASSPKAAMSLCETVRTIESQIEFLQTWPLTRRPDQG